MIPTSVNDALRKYRLRYYHGHLLALVDGVQYEKHTGEEITPEDDMSVSLFAGTKDIALAHAGPWLIDPRKANKRFADLAELEQARPAVIWLITLTPLERQAEILRSHLNIKTPNGRSALLRFWDPRVLHALNAVCQDKNGRELFRTAQGWHYLYEGQRQTINDNATYR